MLVKGLANQYENSFRDRKIYGMRKCINDQSSVQDYQKMCKLRCDIERNHAIQQHDVPIRLFWRGVLRMKKKSNVQLLFVQKKGKTIADKRHVVVMQHSPSQQ